MAMPINIKNLINFRVMESNRVEFISGWNPTPIIHSICAYANEIDNVGGGYIVVGVEENDGTPVLPVKGIPQERVDGILKELIGLCHMIEPLYYPVVEPVFFRASTSSLYGFPAVTADRTKQLKTYILTNPLSCTISANLVVQ